MAWLDGVMGRSTTNELIFVSFSLFLLSFWMKVTTFWQMRKKNQELKMFLGIFPVDSSGNLVGIFQTAKSSNRKHSPPQQQQHQAQQQLVVEIIQI